MDKNITLDRRYSFNTTHIPNPIAESTHLNINGSSNMPHFQWGGTPISPKNRSNSSLCLTSLSTAEKGRGSNSTATSPQRNSKQQHLSKIDPRMYADVQSRGLASRIVKYHENGTRLNRSMSANNLYNKPGQFPVVHLKKTALPFKASKQQLSMTRIAPPEKSMFYGNTLSSLLRSNSVVSLQKSDEEISRENRPILHPPATVNDLAPTRSVLDVLKEISRKRINSDDLNPNDTLKKCCNRDSDDIDSTAAFTEQQQQQVAQSYKRQREQFNGVNQQFAYPKPCGTPTKHTHMQQQHSPEQIAKKRLCSYNNDITSSLSSSIIHANKRKLYEQKQAQLNTSEPLLRFDDEFEAHKSKIQRQQQPHCDLRFEELSKSLSCETPITPIPATPSTQIDNALCATSLSNAEMSVTTRPVAVPQRAASIPVYSGSSSGVESVVPTPAILQPIKPIKTTTPNKPKLTLFNKNYDEIADEVVECVKDNAANEGDFAGIQFVKPKKSTAITSTKNPLIERTQKSKLALMLRGLRGELYQEEEYSDDEIDARGKIAATTPNTSECKKLSSIATPTATAAAVASTCSVNATTTVITTTTAAAVSNLATNTAITTTIATTKQNNIIGINSLKSASTATTVAATVTPPIASNLATTATITSAAPATLGGFKFTPPTTTAATTTETACMIAAAATALNASAAKQTSPLVGIKLVPQAAVTIPTFNFGKPATNSTESGTNAPKVPLLGGFSFSPTSSKSTAALNTMAGAANTGALGGRSFTFGTTSSAGTVATTATQGFGMLNTNTNTTAATTTQNSTTFTSTISANTAKPMALPPYGANTTNAAATAAKPTFNFTPTVAAAPATTSNSNTNNSSTVAPSTFGTTSTNVFVANTANNTSNAFTTSKPTFTFGNPNAAATTTIAATTTSAAQPANSFVFGAALAQKPTASAGPFAFAANAQSAAATGTATTTTTNNFSFTPGRTATNTTTPSTNMFSFGTNTASGNSNNPTTPSFNFGVNNTNAAAPVGHTSNTLQQTTIFGSNNSTAMNTNTNKPNTTFAFGGATTTPATTAATTTNSNLFGMQQQQQDQVNSANSVVKPSFSFGGSSSNNATPITNGVSNTFGTLAAAASSNHNKTFAFGGGGSSRSAQNNTIAPTTTANLFGAGAATNNTTMKLIAAQPTYSFGGNSNSNVVAPTFNFGKPDNKTFSFGSSAHSETPAASNNIFGNANATTFSFAGNTNNAGTSTNIAHNVANNIFAAPTPSPSNLANPGDRPIRRATRRLQKS